MSSLIEALPFDLLNYLIDTFLIDAHENFDVGGQETFPATLLALPFVSRRFYLLTNQRKSRFYKAIVNFRNLWRPHLMMYDACLQGSVSLIAWLHHTLRFPLHHSYLGYAFASGNLDLVNWLDARVAAVARTHISIPFRWCRFAQKRDLNQIRQLLEWAERKRALNAEEFWWRLACSALERGDFSLADWLLTAGNVSWTVVAPFADSAFRSGSLQVVQAVLDRGVVPPQYAVPSAVTQSLKMMQFLHEKYNYLLTENFAYETARTGCVEVLQFLKEKGFPLSDTLPILAVCYCRPNVLQWCKENNLPLHSRDITYDNVTDGIWEANNSSDVQQLLEQLFLIDKRRTMAALRPQILAECELASGVWQLLVSLGMPTSAAAVQRNAADQRSDAVETMQCIIEALPLDTPSPIAVKDGALRRDMRRFLLAGSWKHPVKIELTPFKEDSDSDH